MRFATIPQALQDIKDGKFVIVLDDHDRENEGDLVCAAELITPHKVRFLIKEAGGFVCVPMLASDLAHLQIPPMIPEGQNTESQRCKFTISVDTRDCATSGVSAIDRAQTIQLLASNNSQASDFRRPGHIFPLMAKNQGVLDRRGHTEATIDLVRMAGLRPMGVLCELIAPDGTMARGRVIEEFSQLHQIKIITIQDLALYRKSSNIMFPQNLSTQIQSRIQFPTNYGEFTLYSYDTEGETEFALIKGVVKKKKNVLVRIHSECLTGDALRSARCDCGSQLDAALKLISKNGEGILIYLRQEGRGIGLANKLKAYELQDRGLDTVEANMQLGFAPDTRDYTVCAQILKNIGVESVKLLTNNPRKVEGLTQNGVIVSERVPLLVNPTEHNHQYLRTKMTKLGHLMEV